MTVEESAQEMMVLPMTVKEKARILFDRLCNPDLQGPKDYIVIIEQALHDQIEECAKILDRHEKEKAEICVKAEKSGFADQAQGYALQAVALMQAASEVRALAAPGEENNNQEKGD